MTRPKYLLLLLMMVATSLMAQVDPCPGFRNPSSFNTGSSMYFWSARVGQRISSGASSGTTIYSTCAASNCTDITGHANITATSLNTTSDAGITCCNDGSIWDANGRRFQIITQANAGTDQFTINNGTGMPRIPPGYATSIRLGDPRASYDGAAYGHNWNSSNANKSSEALFYTMRVTAENALLFFNYAVVGRCYSHTSDVAGEFMIRIVKQNDDGTWPNSPINDSLWFRISAPPIPSSGVPEAPWQMGRPGSSCASTTCAYVYKPWARVAVSLSQFIYQTVRIEMYTSDCVPTVDPVYAYIAGDYRAMRINSVGCADASSSAIDTLIAPEELLSYTWYVAETGYEEDVLNNAHMATVPFRQVSETTTDNRYVPQLADFVVTQGPNAGDTIPQQTFMCVMTSALDPAKPITSRVYANVENGKPTPYVDAVSDCDLGVMLTNHSVTYGNNNMDNDSTRWVVYSDTLCTSVLDTLWGNSVNYRFPTDGYYKVTMRVKVFGKECGSEKTVIVRALQGHADTITLAEALLCEGETAVASCTRECHLEKSWQLDPPVPFTFSADSGSISFIPGVGITTISLTTTTDSLCPATSTTTVKALGNTTITSNVDASIICAGDSVTLSATGLEDPRWAASPHDPSLDSQQGLASVVVRPQVTTTYTVYPAQASRCIQNESAITIIVLQQPVPTIWSSKPFIDIADPQLQLEDRSPHSTSARWTFSDGSTLEGQRVSHQFGVDGDSVAITLLACNEERCCNDTTISLPVRVNALWVPNTFTPDAHSNTRFSFVFTLPIVKFEIWIYNRQGLLVHHSDDLNFSWDGRTTDGTPCPQGAYVYFYRYATEFQPERNITGEGTVTLLR